MQAHRREILRIGGIGLLGLNLPRLLSAQSEQRGPSVALARRPSADACILIELSGGPSHIDMWDMKPTAPAEIRGEFRPIATRLPTVSVCEHLPHFARIVHQGTLIRSAHHGFNTSHEAAAYCSLTGQSRGPTAGGPKPSDHPAIGSVAAHCRPSSAPVAPYVVMPCESAERVGGPRQAGFFGGWLGRSYDPLLVQGNPNADDFAMDDFSPPIGVNGARLSARKELLHALGSIAEPRTADQKLSDMDGFQARAFDLLTSSAARLAGRLDREDPRTRERYGRNSFGQSVLLARRFIEAGTRMACVSWPHDMNANWDTHGQNFARLKRVLLPQFDAAVGALIDDLSARALLDRTLVVVLGEFGRSPRINRDAGRDHWNFGYGLWIAGGGIKRGHVHGSTDKIGAIVQSDPVTPAEIVATIYQCLGIAPERELHDQFGRPLSVVPQGRAIDEILT
jgi:Protein of unknown function (DUF1501)